VRQGFSPAPQISIPHGVRRGPSSLKISPRNVINLRFVAAPVWLIEAFQPAKSGFRAGVPGTLQDIPESRHNQGAFWNRQGFPPQEKWRSLAEPVTSVQVRVRLSRPSVPKTNEISGGS
jgi:hypothetical protein